MARGTMARALAVAVLFAPGCVLAPVDLESRPCPCATGWVCDDARNRCLREGQDTGVPIVDAGPDASIDAGPGIDAYVEDPTTACDDLLSDALFCESFEDPSLLHWGVREQYDGTVAYTRERAFRGVGALGAATTAPGGYAERIAAVVGSVSDGDLYVRAYVYIAGGAPLVHASILHVGGHRSRVGTEPLAGFNVMEDFGSMYVGAAGMHVNQQLVAVPRDEWFCVQFMLHVDDVDGVARFWIGDELAGELVGIDTKNEMPYESLGAGVGWSTLTQDPFDVFVDEIAIARTRLPCE